MKFKSIVLTLLFAFTMMAQAATIGTSTGSSFPQNSASCCPGCTHCSGGGGSCCHHKA